MLLIRNVIFYMYYGVLSGVFLATSLTVRLRSSDAWPLTEWYLRAILWGASNIIGLKYRLNGLEKLPHGPLLIASAQQSTWENVAFPVLFSNPAIFAKSELYDLPVVGWIVRHNGYVRTQRTTDLAATKQALEDAKRQFEAGRSLLIFAEGTRNTVPGDARIKTGSGVLYQLLNCPCVPVVLNSGDYFPYGRNLIRPGTVTAEILDPIPAGLSRPEFMQTLKAALDEGTRRLSKRNSGGGAQSVEKQD
jgi:1-acyl-sn-glycerol-3-phosphate acyltransferase